MAVGINGAAGPYVLWLDYGVEGWKPVSYQTLRDALLGERYGNSFVMTRLVDFQVVECAPLSELGRA